MCNCNCQICKRLVISDSVTVVAVGGVDTLVINIPQSSYSNCERVCLVIAQTIPDTATINMPVAISIGGNTTVVYPLVTCNCVQVTACAVRTRKRYPLKVVATSATTASFRVLSGLSCSPDNRLVSIPAPAATPAPTAAVRTTRTQKGVTSNE